jgi:hypothetical protein
MVTFLKDISSRITFSKINAAGGHSTYSPENIIQGAGIKYGKEVFQERQRFSLNLSEKKHCILNDGSADLLKSRFTRHKILWN